MSILQVSVPGSSVPSFSVSQFSRWSCPTLCDPMDCTTPVFPVHRQLPEFTQTQVHRVGDAIQPSHPLSSPSSPAFNLSQQTRHQNAMIDYPKDVGKIIPQPCYLKKIRNSKSADPAYAHHRPLVVDPGVRLTGSLGTFGQTTS